MGKDFDNDLKKADGCCIGILVGYAAAVLFLIANCHGGMSNEEVDRLADMVDRVECLRTQDQHMDSVLRADSIYRVLSATGEEEDL